MEARIKRAVWVDAKENVAITQKEIVELLNIRYRIHMKYKHFSTLINNRVRWSLDVAMALAEILDVSINDLFELKA